MQERCGRTRNPYRRRSKLRWDLVATLVLLLFLLASSFPVSVQGTSFSDPSSGSPRRKICRGLDAMFGFDWSPNDVNVENSQIMLGARYNGPIPARPQDGAALGFVFTHIGDPFQTVGLPSGAPALGTGKTIELNYTANIRPYFQLQPVFQYYVDVGGNSRIPNAALFGFRGKAVL
jgi:carbohydrate-selective porin OprB